MDIIGIEAGNSNIKVGIFRKEKLVKVITFPTKDIRKSKLPSSLKNISPVLIGIASVVPQINPLLKKKFGIYGKNIFIITPSSCGITLKVKNPDRVGVDRILNCKAAVTIFGSNVVVVDIGTAITVDYASRSGFYGGVIMPGPSLWGHSLTTTAMIKDIKKVVKARIPGKDTSEAVCGGIKYGVPGAINNVVALYKRKYPYVKVILTGGGSEGFKRDIEFDIARKHLALEGLGIVLYERYKRENL